MHRPKTGRTDLFPLSQAVGQAIVRYILEVRPPRPERALFLTLAAPIRPLGRTAPGIIVRRRMDKEGIDISILAFIDSLTHLQIVGLSMALVCDLPPYVRKVV